MDAVSLKLAPDLMARGYGPSTSDRDLEESRTNLRVLSELSSLLLNTLSGLHTVVSTCGLDTEQEGPLKTTWRAG